MDKYDEKVIEKLKSTSSTTVYNTLVYIRTKYIKQPNGVRQFCCRGGIKPLLDLVERSKLTDIVLSILGNCCTDEKGRAEVIKQNGIPTIVRIFQCLSSDSIQNRACRTLANICLSKDGAEAVTKASVFPCFVSLLKTTKNAECQQTALRAIRLIVSTSNNALYKEKGIVSCAEFLSSEDVNVLKASVKAIATLTHHCTTACAQKIQHHIPILVKLCSHQEEEVSEQALTSLVNLSYVPAIRPELGNAGAIPIFVSIINQDKKIDTSPIVVALSLCCREVINRKRIQECQGYEALLAVLQKSDMKRLHRHIIACFLSFQYDEESLTNLLQHGLIPALVNHLNVFVHENQKEHLPKSAEIRIVENTERRRHTYLDKAMLSHDESYMTVKPILSLDEEEDTAREDDTEVANMFEGVVVRRTVRGSKVFCIHSPSYQEVQNEAQELPRIQDYMGRDLACNDLRSPGSNVSYCHSPDRISLDFSNSSSPKRTDISSPSCSFRISSPDFSDSEPPFSPASSVNTACLMYSPIIDFSDDDSTRTPNYDDLYDFTDSDGFEKSSDKSDISEGFLDRIMGKRLQNAYVSECQPNKSSTSEEQQEKVPSSEYQPQQSSTSEEQQEKLPNLEKEPEKYTQNDDLVPCRSFKRRKSSIKREVKRKCSEWLSTEDVKLPSEAENQIQSNNEETAVKVDVCAENSAPTLKKELHCSNFSDGIEKTTTEDEDPFSKMEEQKSQMSKEVADITGEHIMILFSYLSHTKDLRTHIATKPCLQAILDCLAKLPHVTKRAERILLRLTRHSDLFEDMVGFGLVLMVLRSLKRIHKLSECTICKRLRKLRRDLLRNMSIIAESDFGMGELKHMLLRASHPEWMQCALSIPYLINSQLLQQKLLDIPVLEKMLRLPVEEPEHLPSMILTLLELCRPWADDTISHYVQPMHECHYDSTDSDVYFILKDGTKFAANKSLISQKSEYFRALLQGSFRESSENELPFTTFSFAVAEQIFHHLYGCMHVCAELSYAFVDGVTELLKACNMLLLKQLGQQATEWLLTIMRIETIPQAYACGCELNDPVICEAAVRYMLLKESNRERVRFCFEEVYRSAFLREHFICDCSKIVNKILLQPRESDQDQFGDFFQPSESSRGSPSIDLCLFPFIADD